MKLVLVLSMLVLGSLASFDEAFFRKVQFFLDSSSCPIPNSARQSSKPSNLRSVPRASNLCVVTFSTTPDRVLELLRQMQGDLQ
jgi:hypothetical protein